MSRENDLSLPIALLLAVGAAAVFAWAAALQHDVVDRLVATDGRPGAGLRPSHVPPLLRSPAWWWGIGLTTGAAALHIGALLAARVSVVQPVGVLAVPMAVAVSAWRHRERPAPRTIAATAVTVSGVVALVVLVTWPRPAEAAPEPLTPDGLWGVSAALAASALAVAAVSLAGPRWLRCVSVASGGAVLFGLASALLRALFVLAAEGRADGVAPLGACVLACVLVGGWLVQQGYASGPPEVVLGCLTLVDPLVAVLLGLFALGEGNGLTGATVLGMLLAGALAAAGLGHLAGRHPHAHRSRHAAGPAPAAPPIRTRP